MTIQRETPVADVESKPAEQQKRPSYVAAFNVGGLNLAPASNDEDFDVNIDALPDTPESPNLFNDSVRANRTFDQRSSEYTNEMGMAPDVKLGNGGGSLSQLSIREIEERKRERAEEAYETFLEQIEEHDKQVKEAQAKWDAETHDYGGEKLSGAEIMRRIEWFEKKENQDKVREELRKQGKNEQEIEETIRKMKERDELMKRQRNGEKLTPEELRRMEALNRDKEVINANRKVTELSQADIAAEKTLKAGDAKLKSGGESLISKLNDLNNREVSGVVMTAAEKKVLDDLRQDSHVMQVNKLFEPVVVQADKGQTPNTSAAKGYEDFPTARREVKAEFNVGGLAQEVKTPAAGVDVAQTPAPVKAPAGEQGVQASAAKVEASVAAFM